jgi:alpha-amylase/alpha-mannosidase (GH57 family)
VRALCLHGHFYQPPREHPWLGVVEPEASAAPYRDWNARITAECYAPNAAARVLDPHGRLAALVDNYAWTSFNFGPTLLAWLAAHASELIGALRRADAASRARLGRGNAWAQAYGHAILPLSTPRDVRTQVLWGRRDFEHRFGRAPEGMWLPEMAVDRPSLVALAEAGIGMTMLAPHQARRVRPLGAGPEAWKQVTPETLDTRRLYRCVVGKGRSVDVVFRDAELSHAIAFGPLLADGAVLASRLREAVAAARPAGIVAVAVDGETYGHHHRFGEMGLAFALRLLAADKDIVLAGPAAFRDAHPPADEVEIEARTSWSCAHGVERWRAGCGCRVAAPADWSQEWRAPLRSAIDWLRDELAALYETQGGEVLRDPWGARNRYVDCVLEPGRTAAWLAAEARGALSGATTLQARRALELARHALLMQTSCGWFFDELTGIEPVQVLRYAARAMELAAAFGRRLEDDFVARLEPARSNLPARESGADVYRRAARGAAATPARVAATGALLAIAGHPADVPGYDLRLPVREADGRLAGDAAVAEVATGAAERVHVEAEAAGGVVPVCRAGDRTFTLADLFGVQRERLLDGLAGEAAARTRVALASLRPTLDPLVGTGSALPTELAALLGWEAAYEVVAALERGTPSPAELVAETAARRRRGALFPARWLAPRLAAALERRLGALPEAVGDALLLLDLAEAAGIRLDLGPAQVRTLAWWEATPHRARASAGLATLCERLGVAPEGT